ncbi:MAG: hypothetical protein AAGH60_05235 [Pseudomonadota bacterium]
MTFRPGFLALSAALALAACGDNTEEEATAPAETEAVAAEEAAPPAEEDVAAEQAPTDLTPEEPTIVEQAANEVQELATEQLNQVLEGQPLDEAGQELLENVQDRAVEVLTGAQAVAGDAADATAEVAADPGAAVENAVEGAGDAASSLLEQAASAVEDAAEEVATATAPAWHSAFSPDVPYYNISDAAVSAFAEASASSEAIGTVEPGGGGFIEACNDDNTWCRVPFGSDGQVGWVDMSAFGGNAN